MIPPPSQGNAGIGGTEYGTLSLAEKLPGRLPVHLYLVDGPQADWLPPWSVVSGLAEAIRAAELDGCTLFLFRPGFEQEDDWPALQRTSLKLIAWLHNQVCDNADRLNALPQLVRWVLLSQPHYDFLRHSRLHRKAVVIPGLLGLPADSLACPLESSLRRDFAYMGALFPFKAFDRLARQWHRIAGVCPEARLHVFGGSDLYGAGPCSPYEKTCRELVLSLPHHSRVLFHGTMGLQRHELFPQIAVAFVNPSGRDETFCFSALEFQACGIPVVAPYRHALIETVWDGHTGLLFRNDRQLVSMAVSLYLDSQWRARLGAAGRQRFLRDYAVEPILDRWCALLQDVVAGRPPQPLPVGTPWYYEQRWLRQAWAAAQWAIPQWPDWPRCKCWARRFLNPSLGEPATRRPAGS